MSSETKHGPVTVNSFRTLLLTRVQIGYIDKNTKTAQYKNYIQSLYLKKRQALAAVGLTGSLSLRSTGVYIILKKILLYI